MTILSLAPSFDEMRAIDDEGNERWSARDLMAALGYDRWENFESVIDRAASSAANLGHHVDDLFRGVTKKGLGRPQRDYYLTRFAAYLVAMNGDPRKEEIAAAQAYFAVQTRRAEVQSAPDLSTPQGVLEMARQFTATAEQLVAAHEQLEEQRPLVQQALTYQAGANLTSRQDFAREVISWGHAAGHVIKQADVFVFLARKLGLFVRGERADAGNATVDAIRRGLAETEKGTSQNGHNYATGKLTPRGKAYAFERIVRYVEQNGTLKITEAVA